MAVPVVLLVSVVRSMALWSWRQSASGRRVPSVILTPLMSVQSMQIVSGAGLAAVLWGCKVTKPWLDRGSTSLTAGAGVLAIHQLATAEQQLMDTIRSAIRQIQVVQLVALGYHVTLPLLPPVARLERRLKQRRLGRLRRTVSTVFQSL